LTSTINAPDIYLRSKVPEDIYETLQKFAEMRKLDRAVLLRNFDIYPAVDRLLTLERKYGDAINKEDLFGFKEKKKRKRKATKTIGDDGATTNRDGTTVKDGETM